MIKHRWKDFLNFKEDMEGTFKPHLELDRINNNKGYSPDNTRWVTRKRNNRNRKDTLYLEVDGVKKPARDWAEEVGINYNTLRSRLRYGWTVKKALNILAVLSMCWVPGTDTSTTGVSATVPLHQGNYWTTKQLYEMH